MKYSRQYPVITLTGPRQSGKTTLCKMLFPEKRYYSLENIDVRNRAKTDPRSFLSECLVSGAILDEIQRVPDLTSYIQGVVDEHDKPGQFILTGSQNFQLMHLVSQSLAGRTALAALLPFSYKEIYGDEIVPIDKVLYSGFYPRIYDKKLNPTEALAFYVSTYIERDMRELLNIKDLGKFEMFLKICAGRTAQIVNLSNMANDCGITHNTARSWLDVLEASYIIFLVRPHHANFGKRLIKAPKLYFTDVGLAAYLLEISDTAHLASHPLKGQLFENFVVADLLKARYNGGHRNNIYYYRDNTGNEIDVILDNGVTTTPVEIKLGATLNNDYFKSLRFYKKINPKGCEKPVLIYGGVENEKRDDVDVVSYRRAGDVK